MATITSAEPGVGRRSGQRRLLSLLLFGNLTLFALYGGIVGVLLPTQVENIDAADKVTLLGVVTGISAIFATLFNPIGGALSDRTRSRFGRRAPWILGAPVAVLILVIPLGLSTSIPLLVLFWCLAQGAANIYQAAITAVVPDRIPRERRGTASAVTGAATPIGMVVGITLAGRLNAKGSIPFGYLLLGGLLLLAAILFVTFSREPRETLDTQSLPSLREQAASFLSALRHADFRWVFIGRALMVLGYFMITGYLLYLLQDHIGLPKGMKGADGVALMTAISSFAMMVTTALGGPLSDRLNRRKAFVFVSSTLIGLSMLLPLLSPHWGTMIIFMVVNGAAFGVYMAVDTAMVTLVLPRQEDAGRDMGVLNIANAGPQIAAPFVASLVINLLGGYPTLFVVAGLLAVAGALAVLPVKSIR